MKNLFLAAVMMFGASSLYANVYLAKAQLDGKTFEDILILNQEIRCGAHLTGSYTVPGVFTAKLMGSVGFSFSLPCMGHMSLDFKATENNEEFQVRISMMTMESDDADGGEVDDFNSKGTIQVFYADGRRITGDITLIRLKSASDVK